MMTARRKLAVAAGFGCCALLAIALAMPLARAQSGDVNEAGQDKTSQDKNWQAVAPGVVEPQSGEIKIAAPVVGRISEVAVKLNDKVAEGEPLIRLDDEEARAQATSARADAAMKERTRNEKSAGKAADRRDAEDAVAEAETALVDARAAFDKAVLAKRTGRSSDAALNSARTAWTNARDNLERQRAQLHRVEAQSNTPLPTQAEGQLNMARAALRQANAALEKLTIRAPSAGSVLQANARVGELASPAAPQPLVILGDLTKLRVRAELDEHDLGKVKPGDSVTVRAEAFRGREFPGKVTAIAPLVQQGRLNATGSRNVTDFSVAEVLIELSDPGPLVPGMNVDVFFAPPGVGQKKRSNTETGQPVTRAPF